MITKIHPFIQAFLCQTRGFQIKNLTKLSGMAYHKKSLYVLAKGIVMLIIINKASTISILNVYSVLGLAKSFVFITLDLSLKPLQENILYEGWPDNEVTVCHQA